MRFLRAMYIFACVVLVILALPFIFLFELMLDCWRRSK